MQHDVDVAIVGGGPAGLATAAAAAAGGLRVVVHERNAAIGEPVRTSGGSFVEPLRRLGVPDDCWHAVHRIRVIGPTTDVVKTYRTPVGCVLDVRRTYQWLGARAVDAGAEIRLKSHVDGLRLDDAGRVLGLRARDPLRGRYDVNAQVVVDASGHTGFLAREAGLRPANERSAVGMEIELRAPRYDQDEAIFWLGDSVAPGGYGWAFPTGEGRVRLGVGVVRPDSDAEPRELLNRLLEVFRSYAGGPAAAVGALEMHSGLMPVIAPTATQLAADRFVVVGDAGGQGSTLLGEGIRYAISAGRMAGEALVAARGDYTAARLTAYPRSWHRQTKRDMAIAYAVNTRICAFGDEDWDRAVRRMQQLTPMQAARLFASDFSVGWAMGVLVTHPSLLRSVGRALRQRA